MSRVALSIGSNIDARHYIRQALDALSERYGELAISSVYESEAVGFTGGNFLNLVVLLKTAEPLVSMKVWLKQLEKAHGREHQQPRFSARTLDVDILCYDSLHGNHDGVELPRPEITENAFVLRPLVEIAGTDLHPVTGLSYAQLWQQYSRQQKLWPIDFEWQGRVISRAEN